MNERGLCPNQSWLGVLILSRFAGPASECTAALLVKPYDPDAVATSIAHALSMTLEERRTLRPSNHPSISSPRRRGRSARRLPTDRRSLPAQVAGTSPGRRPRPIHGNVTFPASTRRRSKTCRDPFAASSMTAQSRCSSTSLPPLMAHNRPAPPGCARGRARWQPNRVAALQPNSAARPAQFSPAVKKLLQSLKNWRHRCGGMSVSGRWWSRRATPSIQLEGMRVQLAEAVGCECASYRRARNAFHGNWQPMQAGGWLISPSRSRKSARQILGRPERFFGRRSAGPILPRARRSLR